MSDVQHEKTAPAPQLLLDLLNARGPSGRDVHAAARLIAAAALCLGADVSFTR